MLRKPDFLGQEKNRTAGGAKRKQRQELSEE
jgi:hypothetical protein